MTNIFLLVCFSALNFLTSFISRDTIRVQITNIFLIFCLSTLFFLTSLIWRETIRLKESLDTLNNFLVEQENDIDILTELITKIDGINFSTE